MNIDIVISGMSILKGSPSLDTAEFEETIKNFDKGPYEINQIQKLIGAAFLNALADAEISTDEIKGERTGVFLGNSYGIEGVKTDFQRIYRTTKSGLVNPSVFPFTTANSIASWLSVQFGMKGMQLTFTGGCVSGSQAVIAGYNSLIFNRADIAVVGGISLLCEDLKDEFYECGFKQEVVACLVLERRESPTKRGKAHIVSISGYKQGFLQADVMGRLANGEIPTIFDGYCNDMNPKMTLIHLGNSLGRKRFNPDRMPKQEAQERYFIDQEEGNLFSAAGVVGMSLGNEHDSILLDIDSYGAYSILTKNVSEHA